MKKVISFSLWGNDPKYCQGAIENARLAGEVYPGWECHFHVDSQVPNYVHHALGEFDYVRVFHRIDPDDGKMAIGDWRGMFWRFEMLPEIDVLIVRDCDSRLSAREAAAVDEWLASTAGFHIMRDHPYHATQILGGMWGMKKGAVPEFFDLMLAWNQEDRWQTDQDFLKAEIYPRVVNNSMVHDEFFSLEPQAKSFPTIRNGTEFVGAIYDENNIPNAEHAQVLTQIGPVR
jgi:hypothetical protein